ncbi:hypothetical protein RSK20926_07618 [Roseobacter sp. SK209-2-6]|uniref:flavin-dependent oxidoreductase n=1 Tax=Roseobacter sp. SK209-2-6 TaxID=388739 RepID=UPI0000F3F437|nr:flavin-dependent oxidoreductase [Roseobacter sp. SK209-2-6]EBA14601.1 hypothetical protein RSK20926_07618 [Roseobacter sp. SK209-2-6]
MCVIIAGGGIAGLSLGLTLHQIGVAFHIYEAAPELRPLGVGINLQPNAVRELFDLGLQDDLDAIGIRTRQLGFYSKTGGTIWEEPRGQAAGYSWPQYSIHRGELQMLLLRTLKERAGEDCITTGIEAVGFTTREEGASLHFRNGQSHDGEIIVAADGIHSAIRQQMYPNEGAPIWNQRILWRATSRARAWKGQAAMVMIGHDALRFVAYPITQPDAQGQSVINWIAEKHVDPQSTWNKEDWNRAADIGDFIGDFEGWQFDWADVPALIRKADRVFEYPMVDRDPLPRWTHGRVTLMGDAAHPTYPVGSNGASQAILDARSLGASFLRHGLSETTLSAYEEKMRPAATQIGKANRAGQGPDAVLQRVEDLCGGRFKKIEEIIPRAELEAHANRYKSVAGFGIDALNAAPSIIPELTRGV